MKFTTVFAVLATVATAVSAAFSGHFDTNAKRLAAGLTPNAPIRRGKPSPTYGAPKGKPSGIHNSCQGGSVQCCNTVTNSNAAVRDKVNDLVGVILGHDVAVGFTCSPLGAIGMGTHCSQQTVCCQDNTYNGIVAIGCMPVNVNLV